MQWKVLKENDLYEINEYGIIRRIDNHYQMSLHTQKNGYVKVSLKRFGKTQSFLIHRLVANNFLTPPTKEQLEWASKTKFKVVQVNHKDGNKLNNHKDNLEWNTASENQKHSYSNGLLKQKLGIEHHNAKLTENQVNYLITHYKRRDPLLGRDSMAKHFNVSKDTITNYLNKYFKK